MKRDYLSEIEKIRKICVLVLDFLSNKSAEHKVMSQLMKDSILNCAVENDRRFLIGFREGLRDVIHLTDDLTSQEYSTLNKLLKEQTGRSLDELNSKQSKKISSVVKRGFIKSNEEYSIIESKVSELSQELDKSKEIQLMNALLINYHKK